MNRLREIFNFKDPSQTVRVILGTLLLLNLIGAGLVAIPPGGSPEQLQLQLQRDQSC